MKKIYSYLAVTIAAALMLSACNSGNTAFEPQHKTETETVNVTDGLFPQVIEKNTTYIQKESEGAWEEESSEIAKWDIADGFDIKDTIWVIKTNDATTLGGILDDTYKGLSAALYIRFGSDLNDIGKTVTKIDDVTSRLDLTLNMTGDIIFNCSGNYMNFYDVAISTAGVTADGVTTLSVDLGNGMAGEIIVPASVQKCSPEEFMIEQSDTYFDASFDGVPVFEVTSSDLNNCVWDSKISNTSYGENISPELTWSPVEGATSYAVFMIDSNWLHMDVFTTDTTLAEGAIGRGDRGSQFVGPYPPKGTTHTYSVFVFALKGEIGQVPFAFDNGGNSIFKIFDALDTDANGNEGNVLAYGRLDGNFTMK